MIRMLKTNSKIIVDGFFITFLQTVLIDDVLKSIMLRNEIFFNVWIVDNHMFISKFFSLELRKKMVGGGKANTCKITYFGGVLGPSDDKINDVFVRDYNKLKNEL